MNVDQVSGRRELKGLTITVTTPICWVVIDEQIKSYLPQLLPHPTATEVNVNFEKIYELKHLNDRVCLPESRNINSRI